MPPGAKQMAHLLDNIGAVGVRLTAVEVAELNQDVEAISILGARLPDVVRAYSGA